MQKLSFGVPLAILSIAFASPGLACPDKAPHPNNLSSTGAGVPAGVAVKFALTTIPDPVFCPPPYVCDPVPPVKSIQSCDRVTWHFGDGRADEVEYGDDMTEHAYALPGIYSVTADIDNALGHFATNVFHRLIVSNPPTMVTFSQSTYEVRENTGGYEVTLVRSGNLSTTGTVRWDLGYFVAADGMIDHSLSVTPRVPAATGSVTFAPFETVKTFSIPILDDHYYEGSSWHYVTIRTTDGTGLGAPDYPEAERMISFQVLDDEAQPTATITDATVFEGTGGMTTADFVITLSAPMVFDQHVFSWTNNGTALRGVDFGIAADNSIVHDSDIRCIIPAGATTCTLHIPVTTDADPEPDKSFTLGYGIAADTPTARQIRTYATGTIIDDDLAVIQRTPTPAVGTKATLQLWIGQPFSSPTSLLIASSNPGVVKAPASVVFAPGSDTAEMEIAVLRSGRATIAIEMPASRGGGETLAIVNTGGAPTLESIRPTSGSTAGATRVTLLGRNLGPQCAVTFGGQAGANVVAAEGGLFVTTPPHPAGYADVRVTCGEEERALVQGFAFVATRRRSAN